MSKKKWSSTICHSISGTEGKVEYFHLNMTKVDDIPMFSFSVFQASSSLKKVYNFVEREECIGRRYEFFGPKEYNRWTEAVETGYNETEIISIQKSLKDSIVSHPLYLE